MSRMSSTPRVSDKKCIRKPNDRMTFNTFSVANDENRSTSASDQTKVSKIHAIIVSTNAIIWLLVQADRHDPTDKNVPAIKKLAK